MPKQLFIRCIVLLLFISACKHEMPDAVAIELDELKEEIDFNFHVKPILSDKCFKCHGPDEKERKGELRLDRKPDGLDKREWVQRLVTHDHDNMMPPPESNLELTAREKAILVAWLDDGAEYKDHWSFASPQSQDVPEISDDNWSSSEIDKFILEKMSTTALVPSQRTDKYTLLRRISFDLTGLPPSKAQIDEYVNDESEEAVANLIDRLQASPQYGERMGLDWLDVARYADTHGYQDDGYRTSWPWRDWVIKAFNENLSYKDFLTWQLAGDMLDNPTKDQLLATGFNRNHPQTQEGGVVDEEYRVEYVADRTNTFGKALIGLTTECARCHDHKYDPISQKDYFSLYAFFNNNNESGIVPYNGEASPTVFLPTVEAQKSIDSVGALVSEFEEKIKEENFANAFEEWYDAIPDELPVPDNYKLLADFSFETEGFTDLHGMKLDGEPKKKPTKKRSVIAYYNTAKQKLDATISGDTMFRPRIVSGYIGNGLAFNGDGGMRFNRDLDIDRNDAFSVSLWVKLKKDGLVGPIFNNANGEFEGYRGWLCNLNDDNTLSFQLNHVWPDHSIDLQTKEKLIVGEWTHIAMTYDASSTAAGVGTYINGAPTNNTVHMDKLFKSLLYGANRSNWTNLPFMLGKEFTKSMTDMEMDELKVYNRTLTEEEVGNLYKGETLLTSSSLSKDQLQAYYFATGQNREFEKINDELIKHKGALNQLLTNEKSSMIMQERKERRPTYILDRGAYDQPTDEVVAEIPAVFAKLTDTKPTNRLELANWLFEENHPLTARVAVNRMWMMLFGKGIVATQEDFGNQGNLPTHPELLDYLALKFIDMDWDIKAFLKMLMLTSTYQQASIPSEEAKRMDAGNIYYSHYPSYRLSAENIRDAALAGSGLLVHEIGGPSVYPYQPPGLWATLATRNFTEYKQQHGDSLYRRSMYTVWKRSSPPPSMITFDAPDRYYCVVQRQKTATPLQSLILMNDPQYLEASRVLAAKMIRHSTDLEERLDFASHALISRPLMEYEKVSLTAQLEEFREIFKKEPNKTDAWLSSGEYGIDKNLDRNELASYTVVSSTIMNFDEFIMKR